MIRRKNFFYCTPLIWWEGNLHFTSTCILAGWDSPALFRAMQLYNPECALMTGLNWSNSCKLAGCVCPSLLQITDARGLAFTKHLIDTVSLRSSTSSVGIPVKRVSGTSARNKRKVFYFKNHSWNYIISLWSRKFQLCWRENLQF